MLHTRFPVISPALLALVVVGCGGGAERSEPTASVPPYNVRQLLDERAAKDKFFARAPDSPIPDSLRGAFRGLSYYPPDTSLRFLVALQRLPGNFTVSVPASGGETRTMTRYGQLHFTVGETLCTLTAYLPAESPDRLFVPFIDETSGTETYEAGRYIDLERTPNDLYLLDLNRAYHPYCAYNASYSCPRVPRENVLSVAIRAGERNGAETH